jgi:predicted KAP-like P-loop ATPase
MPLAGTGKDLGDKIADLITASDAPSKAKAEIRALWEGVAAVIVDHFIANAVVNAGIPVATTGTAGAQTGQTTETGTLG